MNNKNSFFKGRKAALDIEPWGDFPLWDLIRQNITIINQVLSNIPEVHLARVSEVFPEVPPWNTTAITNFNSVKLKHCAPNTQCCNILSEAEMEIKEAG
jgi:hypothetical protein